MSRGASLSSSSAPAPSAPWFAPRVQGVRGRRAPRGRVAVAWLAGAASLLGGAPITGARAAAQSGGPPAASGDVRAADGGAHASPIQPGDRLVVRVWPELAWSDSLLVDAAGEAAFPRLGRVRVAGLAPLALADTVRARYAEYLRTPAISLVVLRRVAVQGAVRRPGVFWVDPTTTLRGVLAQAGGIDEEGDASRITLLRDGLRVPLGRWDALATAAAPVRSGDELVVGRRPWYQRNALAAVSSIAVAASVLLTALRR